MRPPCAARLKFKPQLFALEDRFVLDAEYWVGDYSTDATDYRNWYPQQLPATGYDLYFYGPQGGPFADQYGNSVPGRTPGADCKGLHGDFNSVNVMISYTGTITLDGTLSAADWYQDTGTVDQPGSGTDITVSTNFTWYGGTINSTSNVGTVNIAGASGVIWGTVTSGSQFYVETGTDADGNTTYGSLQVNPGEWDFTNDGGVEVEEYCSMTLAPGRAGKGILTTNARAGGVTQFDVVAGAFFTVAGDGTGASNDLCIWANNIPLKNNGLFTAGNYVEANFGGQVDGNVFGPSFLQAGGNSRIENGSSLVPVNGYTITGGKLSTLAWGLENTANIEGKMTMSGGDLVIDDEGTGTHPKYGTLKVLGDVSWSGGTYHPVVNTNGSADLWWSTGTFTYSGGSIWPGTLGGVPGKGASFLVIRGDGGIVGVPPTPMGGDVVSYIITSNSPVTKWFLQKT
jgi:hypothetical protein